MTRKVGVAIAIALPTIVTFLYFVIFEGNDGLQKAAFGLKLPMFAFPLLWISFRLKERWVDSGLEHREHLAGDTAKRDVKFLSASSSILFGVIMGIAVSAAMWALYKFAIPQEQLSNLIEKATDKADGLGFASASLFIALGVFYALLHSLLEEYYFRWFVFGQLRRFMKFVPAMVICGLAFMAHHVIILVVYFGWSPMAIFLSLSIAVGGMIWAWQYEKSGSLLGPWISHMIVDAGIFYIGFDLLRTAGVL